MLRIFTSILLVVSFFSCSEESANISTDNADNSGATHSAPKKTTLEDFTSYFPSVSDLPTLDLKDMEVSLVLDKESFLEIDEYSFIPSEVIHDWITPYTIDDTDSIELSNWTPIFYNKTELNSTYCLAQIRDSDTKFYLLKLDYENESKSELTLLGTIGTFKYKDSNEEAGEKYDFEITECEDLILEIKNDTLITKCIRYSATVGKDWRIDQNLYVNDTVKLPIIESSYSLY